MALSLLNTQKVIVTAQALDAAGVQVNFTDTPVFSVGVATLAALVALAPTDPQPAAGEVAMWLVPIAGQTGTDTVTVSDAAFSLTGTLAYTVTAPVDVAATIAVTAGAPVAQP